MIRRILTAALTCCALLAAVHPASAQETTWEAPAVTTQLAMDDTIIPVGKGAVFCPMMTQSENEPPYGVLSDGRSIDTALMGHRIVLAPGVYTVVLGTGTVDQMLKKTVRVEEGATTSIRADWSGLIIEVINESRANIREYFEIFDMVTGTSYGIGQGVEEGLDEQVRTWLLPPGIYKIMKPGDNINSVINFGTIRLMPGELVRTNLVMDSKTGNFLGFGRVTDVRLEQQKRQRKWIARSELSGNALLNYIPSNQSGAESDASFTATMQSITDARFESGRHVIPIWANIEEGLSMTNNREIHKYTDKAEIKLTYIYRLKDWFSPYVRGSAESRFFETRHRFEDPTDFVRVDADGDTTAVVNDAEEIKLGSALSPVYLKEGLGITSSLIKTIPVNLNLRSGYGARQTFARNSFLYNSDTHILTPIQESDITGIEMLLLGDIRLGRYIIFTNEFDILMPRVARDAWVYDSENRLRINLTSNVSLLLQFDFWKNENVKTTQTRYQTLLRFSKYL